MIDTAHYTKFGVVPPEQALSVSGAQFLRQLMDATHPAPPFTETTDMWPVSFDDDLVVWEGRPSARFYNPMGTVHGGWIATLLDSVMGCAVQVALPAGQTYTTVEMKTVFVRPVQDKTGLLRCEGKLVHMGKGIATSEGKVLDGDGKLIAYGSETCLISTVGPDRKG